MLKGVYDLIKTKKKIVFFLQIVIQKKQRNFILISFYIQLIFDNSNVNNDKTNKTKNAHKQKLSFLQTFQNDQIFLNHPSERSYFEIKSCSYQQQQLDVPVKHL